MPRLEFQIAKLVSHAIKKAQDSGDLPDFDIPDIVVEHPKDTSRGDLASPSCLGLARLARKAPLEIAEIVARHLSPSPIVSEVEAVRPGFINIKLDTSWLQQQVDEILLRGGQYADIDLGGGASIQVEYGSANPTGPLHVGFGRNVVLGDGLANALSAAGYQVHREYYVNDAGTQIDKFADSLYARYAQSLGEEVELPPDGYQGDYIIEWGEEIAASEGRRLLDIPHDQALAELKHIGLNKKVLASARQDCLDLGIKYDNWFYESQLYRDGQYELVLEMLREKDLLFEHDGALWFAASQIDPDAKEEVVIRSTGRPGYFASDIAYHYNKFVERKFEKVIDVWGADHQGHVPRMKAVMQALDLDPDRLVLIVYQLVTIKMGGEDIRLSKRAGTLVRLRELIDQVGSDAIRYILLSRSADSQMEFDIDLVLEQSDRNPVYYVQYAHARMCSILREAERLDLDHSQGDVHDLKVPAEHSLIKKMIQLSWQIEKAARELSPHFLPYYAHELATELNQFYRDCRVLPSERMESDIPLNITFARLKLVSAARIILARTLELMGMSAPERM